MDTLSRLGCEKSIISLRVESQSVLLVSVHTSSIRLEQVNREEEKSSTLLSLHFLQIGQIPQ
jgi:hypothetical protein